MFKYSLVDRECWAETAESTHAGKTEMRHDLNVFEHSII